MAHNKRGLEGTVAVVTGAARGIGRAIAERRAGDGARVACLDISPARLEASVAQMRADGLDVHAYVLNVARRSEVHEVFQRIEADLSGPLATLVNNAVWASYQSIEEIDEETLEKMLAVGLKGIVWTTQAATAQMKRHGAGTVINLSSAAAVLALRNSVAYCAIKAAVAGLTRAAALDLGPHGIRVNAIAPGMIGTPASLGKFDQATLRARESNVPIGRFGDASEIASIVAFLASAQSSYVNGALIMADGGLTIAGT
ncbi:SDR family oxidoreductase [Pseudomonas aeruginosa]|nr:SDR family oxidoreductase [Pseudomonas aeruginosa]